MLTARDAASQVINKLSGDLDRMGTSAGGLGAKLQQAGSAVATVFAGAALAGVTGFAAGLGASVKAGADFEAAMSSIKAVSGAVDEQMVALQETALQLGKDTSFSAREAAAGIEELIKAGVSVQDVIGGGAAAALALAAAGGVEVAEAAEIASNAMNVFNKSGEDMGHVADIIAGAVNTSAIGMNDFKFALAASGAVANTVGVSFEDLSTAIAAMGNAGIKGSDAGTSLKTFLMNLSPTSDRARDAMRELGITTRAGGNAFFDAQGKVKGMAEVAQVLQNALKGLTKEQQLLALEAMFGSDAIRAAAVIAEEGADGFTRLAAEIDKVTAAQVAAERLNNLKGALEQLKGSLETAAISVGLKLMPALTALTQTATQVVNAAIPILESFTDQVIAAIGEGLTAGQRVWESWIQPVVQMVLGWFTVLKSQGLTPFLAAIGAWIVGAVPQLGAMFARWATATVAWVEQALPKLGAAILSIVQGITGWVTQNAPMIALAFQVWGNALWQWVQTAAPSLLQRLSAVAVDLGTWIANAAGIWSAALLTWATAFVQWITPMIPRVLAALGQLIVGIVSWIGQNAGPILTQLAMWAQTFWAWVQPAIQPLLSALGTLLASLGNWIVSTAAPEIGRQLVEWGTSFATWATDLWTNTLAPKMGEFLKALGDWVTGTAKTEIVQKVEEWSQAFVDWATPAGEKLKQQLTTDSQTLWGEIKKIYSEARTSINAEMDAKQKEFATGHRISLEQVRKDVTQWGAEYGKFQIGFSNQIVQGFQKAWDEIVESHQAFWTDLTTEAPKRVAEWISPLTRHWDQFQKGFQRVFDFVAGAHVAFWNGLSSTASRAASEWLRVIDRVISAVERLIEAFRRIPSGGGGAFGSFPSFRAAGGPVAARRPYIVGERGPELFVPGSSGYIQPDISRLASAGMAFGGGMVTNYVTVHVHGNTLAAREELADAVVIGLREAERQGRTRTVVIG